MKRTEAYDILAGTTMSFNLQQDAEARAMKQSLRDDLELLDEADAEFQALKLQEEDEALRDFDEDNDEEEDDDDELLEDEDETDEEELQASRKRDKADFDYHTMKEGKL